MNHLLIVCGAYLIDRIVGDPRSLPHPVVGIGYGITKVERLIRLCVKQEHLLKWAGILLPLLVAGGSYLLVWLMLLITWRIHPWISIALELWLISTTLATKGLALAGWEIYHHLVKGDLNQARYSLSMVVGRDTEQLDEPEICRGAIETVAENIVDAIVSPLFYAVIGGAPLAMAYRAVNTLDSMVGYKNDKYLNLGFASARLDDIMNYLPARITAMLLIVASWLKQADWRNCWKMIKRDARLHPSPNSGFPEAGVAGALGIQLGGLNYYKGIASHRARMGEATREMVAEDIVRTMHLMQVTSVLALAVFVLIGAIVTLGKGA